MELLDAPLMGQTHRHQLLWCKGSENTLFVVHLKVEGSRNPLASRQLSISNSASQHSFLISLSARQMSWQKIRRYNKKPACFPAHLPQNRPLSCGISALSGIQGECVHLELLQPALQLNPDQQLQVQITPVDTNFCANICFIYFILFMHINRANQ